MPLPSRNKDESKENFISRCMSDDKVKTEFPDQSQRVAVCTSKAMENAQSMEIADVVYNIEMFGFTEDINEENFYVPTQAEYVDFGDETEEWDIAQAKPGLWENIRKKKEREGKNYKPAQPGDPDRPTQEQIKKAQSDKPGPKDPRRTPAPKKDQKRGSKKNKPDSAKNPSGKITFSKETTAKLSKKVKEHNAKGKGSKATLGMLKAVYRRGAGAYSTSHAPKMSRDGWAMARVNAFLTLLRTGKPSNPAYTQDNDLLPKGHPKKSKAGYKYKDPQTGEVYEFDRKGVYTKNGRTLIPAYSAEYQGRKVTLNKPFRTPDGPKKFAVYTKNGSGKVVIVRFGDPNMEIKRDDPARRKSFRARHKCDTAPGPKWKARYWSCRMW
jgi:hypothetical protein|tara:strand:+ start:810 stop:1955 length:1146 start_codon:yes stop_codon:yes gene_type:complete